MITKAIVEEVLSPYQVRIRIPLLDRPAFTPLAAKTEELNVATICTLPNCYLNIQVGDIVFVGFEDNTAYKAVILGHLCREATTTYASMAVDSLDVKSHAALPFDTTIGSITATELNYLYGTTGNIQGQLNALAKRLEKLENT